MKLQHQSINMNRKIHVRTKQEDYTDISIENIKTDRSINYRQSINLGSIINNYGSKSIGNVITVQLKDKSSKH